MNLNGAGSRPKKQAKVQFLFPRSKGNKHCAGINALALCDDTHSLWTASRDGCLIRWSQETAAPTLACKGHTDWVNDLALLPGAALASVSADRTLRLWRCDEGTAGVCAGMVSAHDDYITSLACSVSAGVLVSAGLRGGLVRWDLERLTASSLSQPAPYDALPCPGVPPPSFYALALDAGAGLAAAGQADGGIRLLDPRAGPATLRALRGHTDVVRGLLLSRDGRRLVSASSDGTLRVWDVAGGGRCCGTWAPHAGSVWSLASRYADLASVHTGGRDGSVYRTDTAGGWTRRLCALGAPVSALAVGERGTFWTASSVLSRAARWEGGDEARWEGGGEARGEDAVAAGGPGDSGAQLPPGFQAPPSVAVRARLRFDPDAPATILSEGRDAGGDGRGDCSHPPALCDAALAWTAGVAPLTAAAVTTDRLRVLTRDAEGAVELWDVGRGRVTRHWEASGAEGAGNGSAPPGAAAFQAARRELFDPTHSVGAWFSADLRLGSLGGVLDPGAAFGVEAYARELGAHAAPADAKASCGALMLSALFGAWAAAGGGGGEAGAETSVEDAPQGGEASPGSVGEGSAPGSAAEPGPSASETVTTAPGPQSTPLTGQGRQAVAALGQGVAPSATSASFSLDAEAAEVLLLGDAPWRGSLAELAARGGEAEALSPVPAWVRSVVLDGQVPVSRDLKLVFTLLPLEGSGLPSLLQSRLHAPRVLTVDKVVEYVGRRLRDAGLSPGEAPLFYNTRAAAAWEAGRAAQTPAGAVPRPNGRASPVEGRPPPAGAPAGPDLVLTCGGTAVPWDFSLAAVRQWIWKRSDDLVVHYALQPRGTELVLPSIPLPPIDT
ncbi:hypothetical protein ACKKBF_B35490 [Auxenochlorella protothecoides x Auxenochlorella symbiontica]